LIVATGLSGMNVMRCFFRLFSGRRLHSGELDLTPRESRALSVILLILLLAGLAPGLMTSLEFGEGRTVQLHAGGLFPSFSNPVYSLGVAVTPEQADRPGRVPGHP
jgi:hypothetical protein